MFDTKLNHARNGGGILFCGAGFSADALSFSSHAEVGVGVHLLEYINELIRKAGKSVSFRDLKNAADYALQELGINFVMQQLQTRFSLENVSAEMVDIVSFPWEKIYTTNYDNAVELALSRAKINFQPLNNLDKVDDILSTKLPIVHLHGRAESWNIRNFEDSCILGGESYHLGGRIDEWLDLFRQDIDRAEIVVFVGFNAADFHLNSILRNITSIKDKVFSLIGQRQSQIAIFLSINLDLVFRCTSESRDLPRKFEKLAGRRSP